MLWIPHSVSPPNVITALTCDRGSLTISNDLSSPFPNNSTSRNPTHQQYSTAVSKTPLPKSLATQHTTTMASAIEPLDMDEVQFVSAVARITKPPHLIINLKAEVEAAVMPYGSSPVIPPFSVAEIITMAWVCRNDQSQSIISDEEISDWTVLTFAYYRKMALKELHDHGFQLCGTNLHHRSAFQDFTYQRLFECERLECPLRSSRPVGATHPSHRTYTSNLTSSRTFLRRALGNESSTFDRIFELPAEVRLMIYEEVLRVPARELQYDDCEFDPRNKFPGLRLSSRGERHESTFQSNWSNTLAVGRADSMPNYKPNRWATEPTPNLMALLRVNRQMFEEAMPVFYSVNRFHAESLQELTHMLQHCGARRRACFSNISFNYGDRTGPRTALKAFRLLIEAKYVHSLQISIEERHYLESGPLAKAPPYKSPDLMPGMKLLSIIRVRELEFPRACPNVEFYLRPRMSMGEDEAERIKAKFAKRFRKSVKKTINS